MGDIFRAAAPARTSRLRQLDVARGASMGEGVTLPSSQTRIVLARNPRGAPVPDDFRLESAPVAVPGPGQMLVRNRFISFDPGVRSWLSEKGSYMDPVGIGQTVRGMTLGEVLASDNPAFPPGSLVRAISGWEEVSLLAADALGIEAVTPAADLPLEQYLGALGHTGLTAWVGFELLGGVREGETVVVSAAAGAVGSVAGQLAKAKGARVIGIASAAKRATLLDLGFDVALDRSDPGLSDALAAAAPPGVDFYFENVGGAVLEAVLPHIAIGGRIAASGMIADYNDPDGAPGVRGLFNIVTRRITMRGFFTFDDMELIKRGQGELEALVRAGRLRALYDIREGVAASPLAFCDLMSGRTTGKTLVRLA
jgi:NADPH-dependent curcumin reductase CurA